MASVKEAVSKLATPRVLSIAIGTAGLITTAGVMFGVVYIYHAKSPVKPQIPPEPAPKAQIEAPDEHMFIGA